MTRLGVVMRATAVGGFAPITVLFLALFVVLALSIVPMIGAQAAKMSLTRWQISADHCSPLRSSLERQQPMSGPRSSEKRTPCLAIWKDNKKIAEGREITSTQNHVILFDPHTGETQRVEIAGTITRVVGVLSAPSSSIAPEAGGPATP